MDDVLEKYNEMYHCGCGCKGWNLTLESCHASKEWNVVALKKHPRGMVLIAQPIGLTKKHLRVSVGINHSNAPDGRPWWLCASDTMRQNCIEAALQLPDWTFPMEEPEMSLEEIHMAQEMVGK